MNINLVFPNGISDEVFLISNKGVLTQLLSYLKTYKKNKIKGELIFLYTGYQIKPSDTITSLGIEKDNYIDVGYIKQPKDVSLSLINHLKDDGFTISNGIFINENIWIARI